MTLNLVSCGVVLGLYSFVECFFFFLITCFVGVTEEQFKESWTRSGAVNIDRGSIVVAKARM